MRLETCKSVPKWNKVRLTVKKTKVITSSENIGNFTEEDKFFWAICRKIPSIIAGIVCLSVIVVLKVNWKSLVTLNVIYRQIRKDK